MTIESHDTTAAGAGVLRTSAHARHTYPNNNVSPEAELQHPTDPGALSDDRPDVYSFRTASEETLTPLPEGGGQLDVNHSVVSARAGTSIRISLTLILQGQFLQRRYRPINPPIGVHIPTNTSSLCAILETHTL